MSKCKHGNGFNSKHRNGHSKLETKLNEIHLIMLLRDSEEKKYLDFCVFPAHQGILGRIKAKRCIKKRCIYYRRLYEQKPTYYLEK